MLNKMNHKPRPQGTKKLYYVMSAVSFTLFVILTVLLLKVDVTASGINGSNIGLSMINISFRDVIGSSWLCYNISKVAGIVGLAACALICLMFAFRVMRQKSLKALCKRDVALVALYIETAVFYIVFDKIVINYRPMLKWGETEPESSFPSTHALMAVVIFVSLGHVASDYIKNKLTLKIVQGACVVFALAIILGRTFSGVHWFTDIVGGILFGVGLVCAYLGAACKEAAMTKEDLPKQSQ